MRAASATAPSAFRTRGMVSPITGRPGSSNSGGLRIDGSVGNTTSSGVADRVGMGVGVVVSVGLGVAVGVGVGVEVGVAVGVGV